MAEFLAVLSPCSVLRLLFPFQHQDSMAVSGIHDPVRNAAEEEHELEQPLSPRSDNEPASSDNEGSDWDEAAVLVPGFEHVTTAMVERLQGVEVPQGCVGLVCALACLLSLLSVEDPFFDIRDATFYSTQSDPTDQEQFAAEKAAEEARKAEERRLSLASHPLPPRVDPADLDDGEDPFALPARDARAVFAALPPEGGHPAFRVVPRHGSAVAPAHHILVPPLDGDDALFVPPPPLLDDADIPRALMLPDLDSVHGRALFDSEPWRFIELRASLGFGRHQAQTAAALSPLLTGVRVRTFEYLPPVLPNCDGRCLLASFDAVADC